MTTADVERQLEGLSVAVEWPEPRDLTASVMAAVAVPAHREPRRRATLRFAVAAAVALVVGSAVLVASPAARTAVARLLGFPGIAVEVTPDRTPPPTDPALQDSSVNLELGEEVSLAHAADIVDFPIRRLDVSTRPTVHLDAGVVGGIVTLVYPPGPGLPAAGETGVGALFTQLVGGDAPDYVKGSAGGAGLRPTSVDGQFALWLTGPSHVIARRSDGTETREETRLAANTLLWSDGGITYRMESALPLRRAVELAESLQP